MAYLKVLCDEIFQRDAFLSCFNIQVRYAEKSLNEKSDFQPANEYVLIYKNQSDGTFHQTSHMIFNIKSRNSGRESERYLIVYCGSN